MAQNDKICKLFYSNSKQLSGYLSGYLRQLCRLGGFRDDGFHCCD